MTEHTIAAWGSAEQARIEAWPTLKWRRAVEHMHGLSARVEIFNERRAYEAPVRLSADRSVFELLRPDGVQPPLAEWALYFADAVHNLRVALDSLAWELSVANGVLPANPRRVSFPVTRTDAQWRAAAKDLDTVDATFLARIKSVQAFPAKGPVDDHYLAMLTELDNADKHRRTLVSRFDLAELFFEGSWSLEDTNDPGETGLLFHTLEEPQPGDIIAEFHWGAPLKRGSDVPKTVPVSVTPMVTLNGAYFPALDFLPNAAQWVRETIEFVRRGEPVMTEEL